MANLGEDLNYVPRNRVTSRHWEIFEIEPKIVILNPSKISAVERFFSGKQLYSRENQR